MKMSGISPLPLDIDLMKIEVERNDARLKIEVTAEKRNLKSTLDYLS